MGMRNSFELEFDWSCCCVLWIRRGRRVFWEIGRGLESIDAMPVTLRVEENRWKDVEDRGDRLEGVGAN